MDNNSKIMKPETLKFLRRVPKADYLENQTVTIGAGGGSDTVENLLKGADLQAYEFELEGKRVVLLGFESKR